MKTDNNITSNDVLLFVGLIIVIFGSMIVESI